MNTAEKRRQVRYPNQLRCHGYSIASHSIFADKTSPKLEATLLFTPALGMLPTAESDPNLRFHARIGGYSYHSLGDIG
jgi:hypothetical protein